LKKTIVGKEAFGLVPYPARTTYVVQALSDPKMRIEIEGVASGFAEFCRSIETPRPDYCFNVIASPLRSRFAMIPSCLPLNSKIAPFGLVSTMPRTPAPNVTPMPAAA
jgi:hypothetical protein